MIVVMGASGHVGSAVTRALLAQDQPILALIHHADKAAPLEQAGAEVVVVDVDDIDGLRAAFRRGRRAFLLNPPAPVDGDTDARELETGRAIAGALENSGLEKLVLASTSGARPGSGIGDLTTLHAQRYPGGNQPRRLSVVRGERRLEDYVAKLVNSADQVGHALASDDSRSKAAYGLLAD